MSQIGMEEEISQRLNRFQHELTALNLDGALVVQKIDLYYFSGTDQDAHLWVPASGQPVLMVRRSMERATEDAAIQQIVPLNSFSQIPEYILNSGGSSGSGRIGLEMDVLPVNRYLIYQRLFPEKEFVDVSSAIRETRMIKSPHEISEVSKAALMADATYHKIPEFLSDAPREIDLTGRIEAFYRSQGHPGIIPTRGFNNESIYGQIMSGKWAATPSSSAGPLGGRGLGPFFSQGSTMEPIGRHEPILVDYAANFNGYISDLTRIFSLGRLNQPLTRAHSVTREIQDALAQKGRPGIRAETLYDLALEMVEAAGLMSGFMGYPDPVPFVGHGVGLELDEWPIIGRGSHTILAEGMVIALEPKIVFPGQGVVGIENTFVVTKNGMKKLNTFPDAITVC
ncbi:MAG: aminopeptidase P family protein [Deltaproteobacteria bacterium]|nr:aminopeptidase P family protein [Deltaproteobacteria bacterium]